MSITKILAEEKTSAEDKLERVAEIVGAARKAYDNEDSVIDSPMVGTAHGSMNFNHLEADSKVALLRGEVQAIKAQAVEFVECNPGANMNKRIEELLATHGMFVNISAGTKFNYI